MTQLEQAKQALSNLLKDPLSREDLRDLRYALEAAQNGPPHGLSDGSLTPTIWAEFTTLLNSLTSVQRVVVNLKQVGAL